MKMKKILFILAAGLLFSCPAGPVLIDNPQNMNRTMKGNPNKSWVIWRSAVVPAKPNTWYRASVEIKTAFKPGRSGNLRFRVRQVGEKDKSLVYANIANFRPTILDFLPYSDVFMTRPGTKGLQVYYQLSHLDGTATFRNLRLEEVDAAEAQKLREAFKVPPAYFSPPVYAFEGEKQLPWGYRVSAELMQKEQIPASIVFSVPELKVSASEPAKLNTHACGKIKLASPLKKGKYTVVMTALDSAGRELAKEERSLRVIARPKVSRRLPVNSVEINADGNLIINGKPVLLNGLYHVYKESEIKDIAEAGFNTVIAWERLPDKYLKMLDWMKKYDLYADCVIKRLPEDKLAELLKVIGKHPAIVSFDPEDEPDIKDHSPEKIMPRVKQIRETCPGKPLRISCSGPNSVKKYGVCAEIMCAHNYVIPFGGLPHQVQSTNTVVKSFPRPRKHSPQMTLQSWIHWHDLTRKPQTPEQTRSLAYTALICGAKGLWWYSFRDGTHWDVRKVPSMWTALIGLNAELEDLNDVILTGKRPDIRIETLDVQGKPVKLGERVKNQKDTSKGVASEVGAIGAVWQLPERTVLAVVNTMKQPVRVRISGLPGNQFRELFADDEFCAVKDGTAEIPAGPETTRVFELAK